MHTLKRGSGVFLTLPHDVFPLSVFLDPPRNLTVVSSGKEGQLNVSWLPPHLKYMDDSMIYEVRYAVEGSHVGKVCAFHFVRHTVQFVYNVSNHFVVKENEILSFFNFVINVCFEGGGDKDQHNADPAWVTARHPVQGVGPRQTRWRLLRWLLERLD